MKEGNKKSTLSLKEIECSHFQKRDNLLTTLPPKSVLKIPCSS